MTKCSTCTHTATTFTFRSTSSRPSIGTKALQTVAGLQTNAVARLNKQELRHAMDGEGAFTKVVTGLADEELRTTVHADAAIGIDQVRAITDAGRYLLISAEMPTLCPALAEVAEDLRADLPDVVS